MSSKPKKARAASAVTAEDFDKLKPFESESLHFEFASEDDTHTIERGAPAHGGGVTVDGRPAEAVRHDGATVVVKWRDGGIEEFPAAEVRKTFPAN